MPLRFFAAFLLLAAPAFAQPLDPFPTPIPATDGVVKVAFTEFASLPDLERIVSLMDPTYQRRHSGD